MKKRVQFVLYMGFFTLGLILSISGPMISTIRLDINMSYSQVGLILSGYSIGVLLIALVGGYLADKYGKKPFLIIGGIILAIGLLGCMVSNSFALLMASTTFAGIGFGIYEIGINALCSDYNDSNKGSAMSLLHLTSGIGAIIGPFVVTLCLDLLKSWRIVYGILAVFPIIVTLILWQVNIDKKISNNSNNNVKHRLPLDNKFLWISGIFCFVYVGIESTASGWLPTYWQYISPKSLISASFVSIIFWSSVTAGRLVSGKIADKVGFTKFIVFASLGTMVLAISWVIVPFKIFTIIAILLLGGFLSGIFPIIMASVTTRFSSISAEVSSFVVIIGYLGGFFMPLVIGNSIDFVGIAKIPLFVCGLSLLLFVCANLVKKFESLAGRNFDG